MCVCVFSSHPFWTSSSLDVPAGVTQEESHTGFLIHLPSAVRALIFVARRIQPFLSLVDRCKDKTSFCIKSGSPVVTYGQEYNVGEKPTVILLYTFKSPFRDTKQNKDTIYKEPGCSSILLHWV